MADTRPLDVITIGRSSVDLYGQQIGSRLEDIGSFAKSVGGSPSNMAIGTARLGLKSGLITGVGDEQMGHYIIEQMRREGVDVSGIKVDKERLTALVLLSVESDKAFPLIFYRENCADAALTEADVDEAFIKRARSIVVTGTHFSKPNLDQMQRRAMRIAKANGLRIAFDIDYRPNLWGLAGHKAGEERYIASDKVSEHLKTVLADCDLIVGTEEEIRIAAGKEDVHAALTTIRALSKGLIVLKRGPMGCVLYPGAIPAKIDDGIVGQGFPIEVYNVLGAGDGFMSGFLSGWLRDLPLEDCATRANACGAFAVSRLMCSPEYLTEAELEFFLKHGSPHHALRKDEAINHIHWATTRRPKAAGMMALAIDHRSQLEDMAKAAGASFEKLGPLKLFAVEAAARVAAGRPGYGVIVDEKYGREALFAAEKHGLWVSRPVELPGSRPLRFEFGQDIGSQLVDWPVTHTIKCLAFYHPDDPADLKTEQQQKLRTLFDASRKVGRELLVEIIAGKNGKLEDDTIARAIAELYELGIKPDWWKLEPQTSAAAWEATSKVITANDPWCRGVVLLGLDAPEAELATAFEAVAGVDVIKGFAVGRTIFSDIGKQWLAGTIEREAAIDGMAKKFERLTTAWLRARGGKAA